MMRWPRSFESRFLETQELKLHFLEGPVSGPPLVLVPGQTMPCESYLRVLAPLSTRYHVFAVDVRGHGRSQHTPGAYSFTSIARDLEALLRTHVTEPALVTGNSSGGVAVIALAARAPELVSGVLAEDPPLFSTEWPRLRDDTWVHSLFAHVCATVGREPRDLGAFFAGFEVPVEGRERLMRFPRWLAKLLPAIIRWRQRARPDEPLDIPFLPFQVRLFVRGLSEYDVDFSRAFLEGRGCDPADHAAMIAAVRCPLHVLHASWFRHPKLGLVGAMDDADAARIVEAAPHAKLVRMRTGHVVHQERPRLFVEAVDALAREVLEHVATEARSSAPALTAGTRRGA